MNKWGIIGVVAVGVIMSGCTMTKGGNHAVSQVQPTPGQRAEAVLHSVLSSREGKDVLSKASFPQQIGQKACEIRGGGPSPGIQVSGTCETTVEPDGDNWVVSFIETWNAADFHRSGDKSSGRLSYAWKFKVDGEGKILEGMESGDFAPHLVR